MARRRSKRKKPEPLLGSEAFGHDSDGRATGAAAFGSPEPGGTPRGSAAFGVDASGAPSGSAAVGQSDPRAPLRGALLFGNAPDGRPTGAGAFGGSTPEAPLRGAILLGNDPQGHPTGALAFGNPTGGPQFLGSAAFGAAQNVPDKLYKDEIGYDFGAPLLQADEGRMAGIRRDPRDRVRQRVLEVLRRLLSMEADRLRHGLDEHAIRWGALRDPDTRLDTSLAEELRRWYRKAPGERLGIGHVRDLLEESERMHTFELTCSWDRSPVTLTVSWAGEDVAFAETRHHKEHTFFELRDIEGTTLGYADVIVPRRSQHARVRGIDGRLVGTLELDSPTREETIEAGKTPRLEGLIRNAEGQPMVALKEKVATEKVFIAELTEPRSGDPVGRVEDRLSDGTIRCSIELDLALPQVLAWALATMLADLARQRRAGWPDVPDQSEPEIESVADALGPRRKPSLDPFP